MKRLRWPLLILLICLPVALLALDVPLPGLANGSARARPLPVPDGDHELAYLDYATNANTWERLVTGVARLPATVPGLTVDDAAAFQDSTTATPELVLARTGHAGRLRIRWYKLNRDAKTTDWVDALAERHPAPLALIGGGTTHRAEELAEALARRENWFGRRPALAITTATADKLKWDSRNRRLVDIYDNRTFRFCFGNLQMANAVLEFVRGRADLAPLDFSDIGRRAACPPLPSAAPPTFRPTGLSVIWEDDQYSWDLQSQFGTALGVRYPAAPDGTPLHDYQQQWVPFSVGRYEQPNAEEARAAADIARQLRELPPRRALLVLPTATAPARRFLRAVLEANPDAARRLVVLTGDGISVNSVLRDAAFAWPTSQLNVPMVLFTHNDPVAWDTAPRPSGYTLSQPTSTEDATHFGEIGRVLVEACFPIGGATVADADELIRRLNDGPRKFFDRNGERLGGHGEHVVVVRPRDHSPTGAAVIEVWRRDGGQWVHVRTVPIPAAGGDS